MDNSILLTAIVVVTCSPNIPGNLGSTKGSEDWRFKDHLRKFDPRTVHDAIDKHQRDGGFNYSTALYIDKMIEGMDTTDDLMKFKIENVSPESYIHEGARRWKPSPTISELKEDKYELRVRLYELMRQAIYQARNAMVIMQIYRKKYRNYKLYKMGFLMSKTDNAVKTFSQFAFRAFRLCGHPRARVHNTRMELYHVLLTEERLLSLWLNAQLLTELVIKNDEEVRKVIPKSGEVLDMWKYEDKKK